MINVIIFVINVTYNKKHFVIKEDKTRQSKKIGLADMWMVVVGSGCFLILLSAKVQSLETLDLELCRFDNKVEGNNILHKTNLHDTYHLEIIRSDQTPHF